MPKTKLTLTVNPEIIAKAKEKAREHGTSISKLVENFLKFYTQPTVHCFNCGKKFDVTAAEICPKCGWFICPHCGACGCNLGEEARKVAYQMKKVYDELILNDIRFQVRRD